MNQNYQNNPVTFLIIGAGDRGSTYSHYSKLYPEEMKVIGIAEPDDKRRKLFTNEFELDDNKVFKNDEEALEKDKFADAVIIATPDDAHFSLATKAIEKGYAILLEKPLSNRKDECVLLNEYNKIFKGFVAVCHVLRYAPFYKKMKEIIDSGILGDVITIEHSEGVGWWHQAHSFVRGNWSDTSKSSPMILAKSSHDMDIILWLIGKHCKKISSFGSLIHFKKENAPAGSTYRCTDECKIEPECPYSALKLYLNMENTGWPVNTISNDLSFEGKMKALKEGPYGVCVYHCNNDAVDHQVVSMEFEEGKTASFTMSGFTQIGRKIRVMGTMGEARGDGKTIKVINFRNNTEKIIATGKGGDTITTGHGGADHGLLSAFIKAVKNNDISYISSTLDISLESHLMAFAAEESRITGKVIEL